MIPDPMDRVEARLGEVGTLLTAATGGAALCRLDGRHSAAKELEGRMSVLLELRRVLRGDPDADLAGIAQRWRDDLDSRQAKGASGAWLAYLSGGMNEIEALLG